MRATPIEAVVFDLDDTLYAERDYVRSGYRAVAAIMAAGAGDTERIAEWMWRRFCRGESDRMLNVAAEHFDLPTPDGRIAEWIACYRDHTPTIEPLSEAVDVLNALRGRVKLGVLSDGFLPAQQLKLDALRLGDCFDAVIFTEAMGRECWKPSPAGFERIASELGVCHAACAYIGDNPTKDFVAPNALGWLTIQWRRQGQIHATKPTAERGAPQIVVTDAAQIISAIRPR